MDKPSHTCDTLNSVLWAPPENEKCQNLTKTAPKLCFGVTKKDPSLVFHFHVLNLLYCWSKLGLTKIQMCTTN